MNKVPKIIIWFDFVGAYGRGLLRGITKYSHTHEPWVFVTGSFFYRKSNSRDSLQSQVKNLKADAIIMTETSEISKLRSIGLPMIVTPDSARTIPGVINIVGDNLRLAKMAAEHLLGRGFKNFAYCGYTDLFWSTERGRLFCEIIAKTGFRVLSYSHFTPAKLSREKEQSILIKWLKSLPKPIGLMVCDDDCGRYLLEACKIADLRVPDEIAVIGIDNDELLCNISNPHLSSIAVNSESAGYEAAEVLAEILGVKKMTEYEIIVQPTHIVTRKSTDIMAIDDREVAQALRFIRQNAKKTIQVNQIVDTASISRRALQERFRKIVGRTIHDEITRVRIEQVEIMLSETNEPLSRIAYTLDFSGAEHLSRYFRKETGMTLLAYRKKFGRK